MSVTVRILGDDSDLQRKIDRAGKAVKRYGVIAATAAATGLAALTRSGLRSADEQAKLARRLNTTTDALQRTNRAADLAGVSQSELASATRNLNTRMGQAVQGSGAVADAFNRLGLDAQQLADLPLDERISKINQALADQVPAAERAAVAADIYGSRAGQAISQISPDDISEASRQIERFGGALTDIDAAKIEAANDALSQGSLAVQTLTQRLAVQFAPVLQGAADMLAEMAGESDVFGRVAQRAFDIVIRGAGIAADAVRGIQVILQANQLAFQAMRLGAVEAFQMITRAWDYAANQISEGLNLLIRQMNRIPRVDIEEIVTGPSAATRKLEEWGDSARQAMHDAQTDMHEILMREMPSDALDRWVEDVKERSEEAARAAVEARDRAGLEVPGIEMAEGEQGLTDEQREALQKRMDALREHQMSELERIQEHYEERRELLEEALEHELIDREEFQERMTQIDEEAEEARTRIARDAARERQQAMSQAMGNMAQLMRTGSRKLFEIGKAAAISQALLDAREAIVGAYKVGARQGGPLLGSAYASAAGAATFAQIQSIRGQSFGSSGSTVSGGAGGAVQATGPGEQMRETRVTVALTGGNERDQQVAGSIIEQINEEARRGGRIAGVALG